MWHVIFTIAIISFFGCSESKFSATGSGAKKRAPINPSDTNNDDLIAQNRDESKNNTQKTDNETGRTVFENTDEIFCSDELFNFSVNLGWSGDSASNDHGPDIRESSAFIFKLKGTKGNKLELINYKQDDVVLIVPHIYDMNSIHKGNRVFELPESSFLLFDADNSKGSEGQVNSKAATTYKFKQKSYTIPGGGSTTVMGLKTELGLPMVAHNDVKLSRFEHADYKNNDGDIALKVMHVSHDFGYITFNSKIDSCH